MKREMRGKYVSCTTMSGRELKAFVPVPLPPSPSIDWTPQLRDRFDQALVELGRLDGCVDLLPNCSLLLAMYTRKEAVLSSMIEGIRVSLSDLLLFEQARGEEGQSSDPRQVINYVLALEKGLQLVRGGLPLSLRLIREVHEVLLSGEHDGKARPGEFRQHQNWIGGHQPADTDFVPPPHTEVLECMSRLEEFLNDQPVQTPTLLKAALAHVQFETIHPFLDGNGRVGRILITLVLCKHGIFRDPLLYISLYFKQHRRDYYRLLNEVRLSGDWEAWLVFFAEAVIHTAAEAARTARELLKLSRLAQDQIKSLGRAASSVLQVHQVLLQYPIAHSGSLVEATGLTPATVNKAMGHLENLGLVEEVTARKRNRLYRYSEYLKILDRGMELPEH